MKIIVTGVYTENIDITKCGEEQNFMSGSTKIDFMVLINGRLQLDGKVWFTAKEIESAPKDLPMFKMLEELVKQRLLGLELEDK